ncbi:NAD-dependent epimerase/dehydratase family protein [Saliterribacillus persicus]|uniref:UDP-glucose 4-epimerase n=1 Tax=Saliterribacillus persicus TaxID=930114 RepID=A0A368X6P5_9BACI|nr:NAD-dependent epimerase/dehydratase family protein [Saliterribacillus persicus]RCW62856.1 UDP-glucose 4-epimerase [Saliterribacillus persicus]
MITVVTGGAGFIGSHLVDALIQEGHEVHILDSLTSGKKEYINPKATFYELDICRDDVKGLFRKIKPAYVFHMAAQADVTTSMEDPTFDAEVNLFGTLRLLEASKEVSLEKFIFASTSAVYGETEHIPITESTPLGPLAFYGLSKMVAEFYIKLYQQSYGLPYTILRYANVYGPRQVAKGEGGVIAIFASKLKENQGVRIFGDGEQTRDFIFVDDVVQANLQAIKHGKNEILNVSTMKKTSVNDLVELLEKMENKKIKRLYLPRKNGEIKDSCLSNEKAKQILKWKPAHHIKQGLEKTLKEL